MIRTRLHFTGPSRVRSLALWLAACALLLLSPRMADAVAMQWAPVGDAGNVADSTGYGAVDYAYEIGRFEVTNAQYVEFLNSVAATDTFELYDARMADFGIQRTSGPQGFSYSVTNSHDVNWGSKPVNLVSWYDAIRFTNWMNNGQGNADTETGAYTLLGGTPTPENASAIVRNADAKVWLPSVDEWYKAAYYDPRKPGGAGYWNYPTASDSAPSNALVEPDPGNHANFTGGNLQSTLEGPVKLTDVGAFENSASAYDVFDAAGNLTEWSETLVPGLGMLRAQLGGSWNSLSVGLQSTNVRFGFNGPAVNSERGGFRIARVPEPAGSVLAILGAGVLLLARVAGARSGQRRPVQSRPTPPPSRPS